MTAESSGTPRLTLVEAAMCCPLVGLTDPTATVLHRVDMSGLPMSTWGTAEHATARCGAAVKLESHPTYGPLEWKALRTRGTNYRRCRECARRGVR